MRPSLKKQNKKKLPSIIIDESEMSMEKRGGKKSDTRKKVETHELSMDDSDDAR